MKKHVLIIATAIIGIALVSCSFSVNGETFGGETIKGNGNIVTRNYDVTDFNEISSSLPATVNFTVASDYTCTVHVDENIFDYLEIKVKDGELRLGRPKEHKNVNLRGTKFVIDITAPSLDEANLAGSGDLNFLSPLNEEKLEVSLAGSGNVVFKEEANVDHLELSVAGSGDIYIEKGAIRKFEADVAGSGKIVSHAEVQDMDANVAGSGDITAKVNGTLDYFIAGSGDIKYYGDAEVSGKIAGSGSVNHVDGPTQ